MDIFFRVALHRNCNDNPTDSVVCDVVVLLLFNVELPPLSLILFLML